MPTIPILPGDSSAVVEYKVYLSQQQAALTAEYENVKHWRAYYSGVHDLLLSDDQRAFLEGVIDKDSTDWPIDNKCRKVVDKVRARLNVTGWQDSRGAEALLEDVKQDASALSSAVRWWVENDMDRWEGEVYKASLRDAESYVIVDHNGKRPRFTFAQRWDGLEQSTGIRMVYEDEAKTTPLYAIKRWSVSDPANPNANGAQRATIFTSNAVYKYARFFSPSQQQAFTLVEQQPVDGWYPISDPEDKAWPLPWVDGKGAPLGLAVVPFISPRGSLVAAIIGLNNAINKTNLDLLANADQQGFGLIAIEYEKQMPPTANSAGTDIDPADDGLGLRPGRALETTGHVNKLAADDMKGLLDYARHLTVTIASNSDIPLHEFVPTMGEVPSGAALQMLDAALAMQADECCTWFTSSWRQVMELAQRLGRIYGGYQGEPEQVSPVWAPTAYVDPVSEQQAQTAQAQQIQAWVTAGMPLATALRELGWDEKRIEAMLADKEQETASAAQNMANAMLEQQRQFDQNGGNANGGQ
jgi:hypothetical protein